MMLRVVLILSVLVAVVNSHGRLRDPPSRASKWRDGFPGVEDVNDSQCNCGGLMHQYNDEVGKCGICGDPWDQKEPRQHELGGIFGDGTITRNYTKGQIMNIWVELTANHFGWFEFSLCPLTNPGPLHDATQQCLDQHVLRLADGTGTKFHITEEKEMNYYLKLKLPEDLTCEHCVFQWHWTCGNNWGLCTLKDGSKVDRKGCGNQEIFRGCADISIQ